MDILDRVVPLLLTNFSHSAVWNRSPPPKLLRNGRKWTWICPDVEQYTVGYCVVIHHGVCHCSSYQEHVQFETENVICATP